uniref:Uncharacterized protein n=1 Tax=Romanomermis culicivorax TaxID=13658 RepID=A0A915HTD3_ROMCU
MKFFTLTLAVALTCVFADGLSEVLNRIDSPTTTKELRPLDEKHADVASDKATIAATRKLKKRESCFGGCMRCRSEGFETCSRDEFVECIGGQLVELKCLNGEPCHTDSSMFCGEYECW